jgi:DNA-binding NarL/FixJ family response regulator
VLEIEQAVLPARRAPLEQPGSNAGREPGRPPAFPAPAGRFERAADLPQPVTDRVIAITVIADDSVSGQGAVACLDALPDMRVVSAQSRGEAEVAVILVRWITDEALAWMEGFARECAGSDPRFVLVGDGVREYQLLRAVTHGVVSVIPRELADFDRIAHAIRGVQEDQAELPSVAVGWLIKQIRAVRQKVLEPNGLTPTGLETREVEVLRLLADGLDTAEIAERLKYSERTVKNIIHGVLTRLKLRNRVHAVSFALRSGAI